MSSCKPVVIQLYPLRLGGPTLRPRLDVSASYQLDPSVSYQLETSTEYQHPCVDGSCARMDGSHTPVLIEHIHARANRTPTPVLLRCNTRPTPFIVLYNHTLSRWSSGSLVSALLCRLYCCLMRWWIRRESGGEAFLLYFVVLLFFVAS